MREQLSVRYLSQSLVLVFTIAVVTGCQAASHTARPPGNTDRVMNLWSTYKACIASSDFEEVQDASDQLRVVRTQGVESAGEQAPSAVHISQFSTQAPSRLAVDVHAMAASCALHAGDIASNEGRENIAKQLYREVVSYEAPAYSFYIAQARSRLAQLQHRLELKEVPSPFR
jgi:hypothetical protein